MRVRVSWAVALLLVAALGFAASYRGALAPVVLVLAVGTPFALVALGRALRLGTGLSALVVIVLGAVAAWLVLRGHDVALSDAVPRLLTTPRPAPSTVTLLTPTVLLVLLVSTLAASAVLTDDAIRTALIVPPICAVLLYVSALVLSAGAADRHGIVAAALVVVALAGWSQPYLRGGGGTAWRPAAVVPAVLAVVVALGLGTLVGTGAFDPRQHVRPPTVRLDQASPLTQLRSWTANPSVRILQASVRGTDRLHLATLDTFTGADWQVDARYQQLGLTTSATLPAAQRSSTARATIRVVRLGGEWLPSAGTATASSLDDVLVDADDGTLARPGRVAPGLTYDVAARVDDPSSQQLSVAAVPTRVPAQYLALPDVPVAFTEYARAAVRGASTPLEEAIALEHAVATDRRVDPHAASGSSYGRLSTFLFARSGTPGAGVGTSEQFAAGFAVLARAVGLPTRLTVGFDVTPGKTVTVRGRDATVWPEVYLAGAGWVAFAPTPGSDGSGAGGSLRDDVLQRLSQRASQAPPIPPVVGTAPPVSASQASTNHAAAPPATDDGLPGWLLALIVVVALLLVLIALVVALRAVRTRRHRDAGARGAWSELLDLLVVIGRRPAPDRTAPQVADDAQDVLGAAGRIVAAAAEREAYAPGAVIAAPVWGHVRVMRRQARRTLPAHRRLLLPLDPRPLTRR